MNGQGYRNDNGQAGYAAGAAGQGGAGNGGGQQMSGNGYYANAPYTGRQPGVLDTLSRDRFIKGALIGAAATYLLTNEQVQRTAIKGLVRTWSLVQGGVEELKERFGDAQAEIRHAESAHTGGSSAEAPGKG